MPNSFALSPPAVETTPEVREFGDATATRSHIYNHAISAISQIEPMTDGQVTLALKNVDWADPERFTRRQRKQAVLGGDTLARRVKGTWELTDNATGELLHARNQVVARVPYLSSLGTFTYRGNEATVNHQQRLRSGVYAREMESGGLESHVNVLPGDGLSHRYFLDPSTGLFKLRVAQAEMPLLPLLRAMGTTDQELRDAWGDELFGENMRKDDPRVIPKLLQRVVRAKDREAAGANPRQAVAQAFAAMKLDPEVTARTLGRPYDRLSKEAILAATSKLLRVSRKEAEPDNRDHPAFQTFVGPEDLFAERIRRDHSGVRRGIFREVAQRRSLDRMPSGALTSQLEQVLLGSRLAESLEEINPMEVLDKQTKVTRLGEGGLPSIDAIPDASRAVQGSHLGFIDGVRTVESLRAGVDLHFARAARKGADGRIYTSLQDRHGRIVWRTPQDLAGATIATPDALKWTTPLIPTLRNGNVEYQPRTAVDYVVHDYESASSSPLGNLIPFKAASKPHRVAMGSRYITQALPLVQPEAPLVRNAVPGRTDGWSFEDELGHHAGSVRAAQDGQVLGIKDGVVTVRYADGQDDQIELYENHPLARKTLLNQTPLVRPGQTFTAGQPIVRSNYTDDQGAVALGANLRTAYAAYKGLNYEDASVISESAAKRLTSEHAYQHDLEVTDKHRMGKPAYLQFFPSKYDRKTLDTLDDRGYVRPGQTVEFGQPLILAAKEREDAANRLIKRKQPAFTDDSVVWKHHDPGVVTDVVESRNGPVVLVKSHSQMRIGDKLCYDPGTRMLTKDRGWVGVAEVTTADKVATLNPQTDCLEWQSPTHVWAYDYEGEMYELVTQCLDMLVTPDHRLWVARPGKKYQAMTARDFWASKGEWQFKKDCRWVGRARDTYTFPPRLREYQGRTCLLWTVPMADWLEFLGYYIAEGWVSGSYVKIGQFQKSRHWAKIDRCLRRLGLPYRYEEKEGRFELGNVWLAELLSPLGDSYSKRVPEFVQGLPPAQIAVFFDAYMAGDGHKGTGWEYSTSSEGLAYDLQLLCLKLGWVARVTEVTRSDNWSKARHWRGRINRGHLRPWWKKSKVKAYSTNREGMVPYSGKVYCVTVPNHIVYVERGGKSYWSLNSGRYG